MNKLTATMRSKADQLANIRSNGMIPAVVYGARVENTMISVSSIDFEKILKVAGESSTIALEVVDSEGKGSPKKFDVLIHDMQFDPVKGFTIHVDFLAIDINKPVEVTIPIEFTGVAPAEKQSLGVLVKVLHEVEVEGLPKDLPHNITVDLSTLVDLDSQIRIGDITLPKGITMKTDAEELIAMIAPVKEEEVEEAPVDLSAIEVEKKGKKEEEPTEEKE